MLEPSTSRFPLTHSQVRFVALLDLMFYAIYIFYWELSHFTETKELSWTVCFHCKLNSWAAWALHRPRHLAWMQAVKFAVFLKTVWPEANNLSQQSEKSGKSLLWAHVITWNLNVWTLTHKSQCVQTKSHTLIYWLLSLNQGHFCSETKNLFLTFN